MIELQKIEKTKICKKCFGLKKIYEGFDIYLGGLSIFLFWGGLLFGGFKGFIFGFIFIDKFLTFDIPFVNIFMILLFIFFGCIIGFLIVYTPLFIINILLNCLFGNACKTCEGTGKVKDIISINNYSTNDPIRLFLIRKVNMTFYFYILFLIFIAGMTIQFHATIFANHFKKYEHSYTTIDQGHFDNRFGIHIKSSIPTGHSYSNLLDKKVKKFLGSFSGVITILAYLICIYIRIEDTFDEKKYDIEEIYKVNINRDFEYIMRRYKSFIITLIKEAGIYLGIILSSTVLIFLFYLMIGYR